MSAMGAAELPEVPAALPQDSPRNRAAARWAGAAELAPAARPELLPVLAARPELLPVPAAPAELLPVPAARPELLPVLAARPDPPNGLAPRPRLAPDQAARNQAARDQAARDQAARDQAARDQAATRAAPADQARARRGRGRHRAAAGRAVPGHRRIGAGHEPPGAVGAAQQNLTQVTVRPGQSLWSVAESADPDADTRVVIQQIVELNGLTGNVVFAGQRLWVPRG